MLVPLEGRSQFVFESRQILPLAIGRIGIFF